MKLLLALTRFFKACWVVDHAAPPYPLTPDEWEVIQQDCREGAVEKALKKEFALLPLVVLAGQ